MSKYYFKIMGWCVFNERGKRTNVINWNSRNTKYLDFALTDHFIYYIFN